ncbi:hypothetical protein B0H11DRAFT_2357469 [Mycena galericulata]|nr:hypothetical protein B0H11DRAFT_2357469 [Mycena galericulata]
MDQSTTRTRVHIPHSAPAPRERDTWLYPPEIAEDLKDVDLADEVKAEILATAWEYTRCVIPHYTNWGRYIAFVRTIAVATGAELKGSLVDVMAGDNFLGYSIEGILAALFEGTSNHAYYAREYRCALLIMGEKASNRRDGELFRQYANSLVQSPRNWCRMRDCDSLARYTLAAALACNDLDDVWFSHPRHLLGYYVGPS